MVTKTNLPSNICDGIDSSNSRESSDRTDSSDSSDSSDPKKTYFSQLILYIFFLQKKFQQKLNNSNCDKTQRLKL